MKLTNKRLYLDYNSTSPLASSVIDWLAEGDFCFGNPSSAHRQGRASLKKINSVKNYLHELFSLTDNHFNLFFHSGATEGLNTVLRGRVSRLAEDHGSTINFFHIATDHPSITSIAGLLKKEGHRVFVLPVNSSGEINSSEAISKIKNCSGPVVLNYTYVNNETGVVLPLVDAVEIKKATGCFVHVDSVQSVGKIKDWEIISEHLDAYTFSGHKFGALTGVGFSFVKKGQDLVPLIFGGGGHGDIRPGTANLIAIISLELALREIKYKFDDIKLLERSQELEEKIQNIIGENGEIIAGNASHRALNTIYLVLNGVKADQSMMAFDLAGIDISNGPACGSALSRPSHVLLAMGYSKLAASSSIRLSFSPLLEKPDSDKIVRLITPVIKGLIKA